MHAVALFGFGIWMMSNPPDCQRDSACAANAAAAELAVRGHHPSNASATSCLVITPANGNLGSCERAEWAVALPANLSANLKAAVLPHGASCELGCHDKFTASGRPKVTCQAGQIGEEGLCYVDTLSFTDYDDDSYLTCLDKRCPPALSHQFKAFMCLFLALYLIWMAFQW